MISLGLLFKFIKLVIFLGLLIAIVRFSSRLQRAAEARFEVSQQSVGAADLPAGEGLSDTEASTNKEGDRDERQSL